MARAPPSFDVSDLNSTSRLLEIMDLNDHHHRQNNHHHQQPQTRMEDMDIEVMDVPDTPDRWIAPKSKSGGDDVVEVDSSNSGSSRLWDKPVRNSFREQGKLANPNRSNRLFSRPQGGISILNESEEDTNPAVTMLDSPPSSLSSFRKMMTGKQIPTRPRSTEFARPSNDRTKLDSNGSAFTEVLALDDKVQERNKAKVDSLVSNQGISSNAMNRFGAGSMRKKIAIQGHSDEGVSDVPMDHGKGVDLQGDVIQKGGLNTSKSQHLTASPRTNGHRRLVRNGCISPLNIAKNKHTVESTGKNSADDNQKAIPNCRIQASEGSHTDSIKGGKGKEVVGNLPHAQEYYTDTIRSSNRHSLNPMEEVNVNEDASGGALRPRELMGGWISTRHRSRTVAGARSHEVRDPVPFQQEPTACSVHGSSSIVPDLDRNDGEHRVSGNLGKRQRKRNPTSSNFGECSSPIFDGSEVAFVRPPVEPSNARLVTSRNNCHHDRSAPFIDIDEFPPGVNHRSPQITTQVVDDDSYARARQLEADEKLARELQEQFYQLPEMGGGETDASLAWAFQQEEERRRASSRGRQRVHPRDSSMSHLYRSQFQNSIVRSANRVNRGANRGRAQSVARPARLRDRFVGHSPSVSARARGLQFPPNMDVEMRIHILEMLEASAGENDGMTNLLQVQRDFNENDYEMLLALDDGNHQHGGASSSQINGLPQSTVQTDNFDEACSICLETPTIGDTIRHLPCLHKFHKDCIDPWLRRKKSCPVCKSGIT